MWKVIVTTWIPTNPDLGEVGKYLSHVAVFEDLDTAIEFIVRINEIPDTFIVNVVINSLS